ncbi:MAG: glycosyltransferase family 39 protein [Anaerolineae bacterium]|nr:glycosyltransferase family 39 protein [Anaerolineae bacterium]MDQ7034045.1 glycosyltransferase family 39 protein [Anaerolineae bacterium]
MKQGRICLWMLPLLLLVTWLGARGINADILFVDEYWSIRNSGGDPFGTLGLMGIWERTATLDPGGMGVLYHWLLNAWGRLIGWSIFSVRTFSLLAGLLALAMLYRLGGKLFNRQVGLYSAAVLGLSAFFIDYLHEARAYTLLVFLVSFTIYAYHKIMIAERKTDTIYHVPTKHPVGTAYMLSENNAFFWYIALSLSLAALAYTHYVALTMGVVLGIFHLTQFRNERRWWFVALAMAIGGMLFLPWLGVTLTVIETGASDVNRQATSMTSLQILQNLPDAFSNANLALLSLLLILALRQRTKGALLLWVWLIVALVMVVIVNVAIPFMVHLRYLMIVFPAFALIVGLGIWHIRKMGVPVLLILLVWMAAGLYQSINPTFIDNQFGQIYRAPAAGFNRAYDILNERAEAGDTALFHIIPPNFEAFNLFVLGYYFNPFDDPNSALRYDQFERMNDSVSLSENVYLRAVWDSLDNAPAVWTVRIPELETTQHTNIVNFALDTAYSRCETVFAQDDMVMELYARRPNTTAEGILIGDDAAQIAIYNLQRGYQTDDALHVTLGFVAENVASETYSVAVHLLDSDGVLVSQVDTGFPNDRPFACLGVTLPMDKLATGAYTLQTIIYNWQTGIRLQAQEGNIVVLETIQR